MKMKGNDWASKKLFLIADEVVARQEINHVKNKLKGFITSDRIRINPKNIGAYDERNYVNVVFLSCETQPLVLERDDHRYMVSLDTPLVKRGFPDSHGSHESPLLGMPATGSTASTENRGQLSPAHSRWLQGYPAEWDSCGVTAMQSCRSSPRK